MTIRGSFSAKTIRGKTIDISHLLKTQGHKPAIGNANLNARGDLIDKTGRVVKSSEQMVSEYNRSNPKAVSKQVALKSIENELNKKATEAVSPRDAVQAAKNSSPDLFPKDTTKKRKLRDDE